MSVKACMTVQTGSTCYNKTARDNDWPDLESARHVRADRLQEGDGGA